MNNPEKIKQILLSEIENMNQHRENFCRHPGIDFTRDRKNSFDTLLHFQISMESGSVNYELLKYFNFDAAAPSLSAFYQQRAKLSDDVFQKLFYSFNRHFIQKRSTSILNRQASTGTSAKRWLSTISRLKGMGNTKYPCVPPSGTAHIRTS